MKNSDHSIGPWRESVFLLACVAELGEKNACRVNGPLVFVVAFSSVGQVQLGLGDDPRFLTEILLNAFGRVALRKKLMLSFA
jgi:hypothetical protein